jgi:peptidoglycan pentaglycine glycine transferase (the first glycine)
MSPHSRNATPAVHEPFVPIPAASAVSARARAGAGRAAERWGAWDRFLEATPATGFMQASWWADFRTTVGFSHFAVILKRGDDIAGGAMVQRLRHRSGVAFYYIQDGPVLPEDPSLAEDVFAATLEAIEQRRRTEATPVSHLRIEPRWEQPPVTLAGFEPIPRRDRYREPRNTLCIDLRPSPDAILAAMRPKGRYNISVARRHGVTIAEDTSPRGLIDFLRIYRDTADRQEFRTKHDTYFEALLEQTAAARHASICFADHEGTRLAAALVIRFGSRATYFYGGSLAERRHVMAPYLLHFEILCRARAAGIEWYDFWGVAPEGDERSAWAGLSVFKRRFGGREVRLVPTLDYVYDRDAYMRYAASEASPGTPRIGPAAPPAP